MPNNSWTEYIICLATIVITITVVVIVLAGRKSKNLQVPPDLTTKPKSPNPVAGDQLRQTPVGSPDNSKQRSPSAETSGRIFVSYRRSDSADIAGRIYDRLIVRFGRGLIFKDVDSIPLGIDFREYLDRKVSECEVLLAIIGDHWVDAMDAKGKRRLEDPADFVRIEIEAALERGVLVIPLLVRGAQMPAEESLPPSLRKLIYRNGIPVRADPDFHHDMDRLIAALDRYLR